MLWVNLIMDTFAAMALASLPPSMSVMKEKPRDRRAFIINRAMWKNIIGVGGLFFVMLLGFLWYLEHTNLETLSQMFRLPLLPLNKGLSGYELSLFFTVFVFLQLWNMFNAKAFGTRRSALHLGGCGEFCFIALMIFVGQILIVQIGGEFFNVEPLRPADWLTIILGTSLVLWAGEVYRLKFAGAVKD